jgi:fructose-bisphosphate aldolase class 1
MTGPTLTATARALVAADKGLLAMDESNPTCTSASLWPASPRPKQPGGPTGSDDTNVKAAQDALFHRARCNQAARAGTYDPTMEET